MSVGCAECEHWDKPTGEIPESSSAYLAGWRVCGLCEDVEQYPRSGDDPAFPPDCGMMAFDASNYFAGLLTSPTFRCIHWAKK